MLGESGAEVCAAGAPQAVGGFDAFPARKTDGLLTGANRAAILGEFDQHIGKAILDVHPRAGIADLIEGRDRLLPSAFGFAGLLEPLLHAGQAEERDHSQFGEFRAGLPAELGGEPG